MSLDPPAQSKVYAEIELMIVVSANKFILKQHELGLIAPESVKKVTDMWRSKNRPQVIDFQFDQVTQRDLILYNRQRLRFPGEYDVNPVLLTSTLHQWKALAKDMSVRTLCSPDSMIWQNLVDTTRVLKMLGAPPVTSAACKELFTRTMNATGRARQAMMEREAGLSTAEESRAPSYSTETRLPSYSPIAAFHRTIDAAEILWEHPAEN